MTLLRRAIASLVLLTQVVPSLAWAQTLPITVDRNVAGQRPVVGVGPNGVPVVNIAPPSAGGVSNNRYTQFNVGPSGVVLNNSGAGSQSQLAGGIAGNPMLGNQRATTILNQVTANNPSQLRGMLEVAGHRANVIVANPAGITCDGCGFLNTHRGTLTTGRPILNADGSVQGFDIGQGSISVDGLGLYGAGLSQVDLLARALAINASIWAERVDAVAGANIVDYNTGAVQAQAAQGAAPGVAIDLAALGGMYANSIRLVGTEAGVGVNVGGNLAALTGALEVSANGDVRFAPTAALQAGTTASVNAARDLAAEGRLTAGGTLALQAGRDASVRGALQAGQDLTLTAGGALAVAQAGGLWASRDLALQSGQRLTLAGQAQGDRHVTLVAGAPLQLTGATVALGGDLSITAQGGLVTAAGTRTQAAGNLLARAQGGDAVFGGTLSAGNSLTLSGTGGLTVQGAVSAANDVSLTARDGVLNLASTAELEAGRDLSATAGAGLSSAGQALAGRHAALQAGSGMQLAGRTVALGGDLTANAQGDISTTQASRTQAAGTLRATAGGTLSADGILSADGSVALRAQRDLMLAGTTAALSGDLFLQGDRGLTLANTARAQAGGKVTADAGTTLKNEGILSAGSTATLNAGSSLDNTGTVLATGNVDAKAVNGQLTNTGRILAGVGVAGELDGEGSLTLGASQLRHSGLAAAGKDVTLTGGTLNLSSGTVSAGQRLALTATGDIDAGNAVLHGNAAEIAARDLALGGGKLTAATTLDATLQGKLDTRLGTIAAGESATLSANTLDNQGGVIAAKNLSVTALGTVTNLGGLLQADAALDLSAAALDNRNTRVSGATQPLGVLAGALTVRADRVDNASGQLAADASLDLRTAALDNAAGLVSSQAQAELRAGQLGNAQGTLAAGERLAVVSDALTGAGRLQSQGDLALTLTGGYTHVGSLVANRDLTLSVGAGLDNTGIISAGRDLTVGSQSLTNRAGAEIVANGTTTLNVSQQLHNAGLIDGGLTRITAGSVTNVGRIYGDAIAIQAGSLVNDVAGGVAGVIASRGDMDLGVGTLVNREHALIYADQDLRIGGALDAGGRATGQAQSVTNASATIEAGRHASIGAVSLRNENLRFDSEVVETAKRPKVYYRLEGSAEMIDGDTVWVCDSLMPYCNPGTNPDTEGRERMKLVLPSETYPFEVYGPPFYYFTGPVRSGQEWVSAPIPFGYATPREDCDDAGRCSVVPAKFDYDGSPQIWEVFQVPQPENTTPAAPAPQDCSLFISTQECYVAHRASLQAYEAELDSKLSSYKALEAKLRAFNSDFRGRMVDNFTYYQVDETISESRTLASDPGRILSGGNMSLAGTVVNDKSQILAGGALSVSGPEIQNIGAVGERRVEHVGSYTYTWVKDHHDRGYRAPVAYADVAEVTPINLAVAGAGGGAAIPITGNAGPGASGISAPTAPPPIVSISLPGSGLVRTVTPPATIPRSSLYQTLTAPDAPYLVATDSRFLGGRDVLSSDFLLQQLRTQGAAANAPAPGAGQPEAPDPFDGAATLKRLGDGFYEQRLVADQIMAGTGQRYVGDYSDNEAQYKALLTAGAEFAGQYGLTLGTALTDEQMRHLTTDLVWMVAQTVTLPDGSTQTVLVPQVYLVVREGDLKGDGTLIAGRDVTLDIGGDILNSGAIGARDATVMTADNIRNQAGGLIQGGRVDLNARQDIDNIAARIKGEAVALEAGRDVNLTTTTDTYAYGNSRGTHISGVSRVDAGSLDIRAGQDVNLTAAAVSATDDARLQAGRDINLGTVQTSHQEAVRWNSRNSAEVSRASDIGSVLAAGGDLTLIAGQDVNARAAHVTADQQLAVGAGRDINLLAGEESAYARDELRFKTRGTFSSKTTHTIKESDRTLAIGATFTGDSVVMMAGRDLTAQGSNIGGMGDVVISAERDVNIVAAENTSEEYNYKRVKKSGFGALGGISYGSRQTTDTLDGEKVFHTGSTVGSVSGDLLINAGESMLIAGSNILARQGDVSLVGRDIRIEAVTDTAQEREFHEVKQSGLTVSASNPVVSAAQTGAKMADAASRSGDPVMQALALGTTALAAVNAVDAVAQNGGVGGVSINISLGSSKSQTTIDRSSSSVLGSNVAAGNDLTLVARGGGAGSDITVTGSNLSAGNNAVLKADGDILLQAAQNLASQQTKNKSSSASVGVGVKAGGEGMGFYVSAAVSQARGNADGHDSTWTQSTVTAGNVLALQSGGDTTLRGAVGQADQILASVGGNLLLESQQDTSTYKSKQSSAGVSGSLCYGCASSVAFNIGRGKMNSDYASVTQQTGLKAGDGGFLIDVGGNTTLIGSVISSSQQAVADGLNHLSTGTLSVEDIKNRATYSASQVSVGGGYSFGGGDQSSQNAVGRDKDGNVASGGQSVPGSSVPSDKSGLAMGLPVAPSASGNASSTTRSGISEGVIEIRDEAGQQALTGKSAAETIASLNRDTTDTLGALKPIFDKEKIEAGFEIGTAFAGEMGQFLTNRAKEADALKKAVEAETDPIRQAQLQAQFDDAKKWGPGGEYRQVMTVIAASAGGNVTGGAGEFVQAAAVNYLHSLGAAQIKMIADDLGGEGSAGHIALHAVLACAGAAGQGASCGAGAVGASASVVLHTLLANVSGKKTDELGAEDQEARLNAVTGLLAGITSMLDPSATAAVANAARIEGENNNFGMVGLLRNILPVPGGNRGGIGGAGPTIEDQLLGRGEQSLTPEQALALAIELKVKGIKELVPGYPAEPGGVPDPLVTPVDQPGSGESLPGRPSDTWDEGGIPGQEDPGERGGSVIVNPMEPVAGLWLIFNQTPLPINSAPSPKVTQVIEEALSGKRNFTSGVVLSPDEVLDAGNRYLGPNYKEIGQSGSGVFISEDGKRVFRIDKGSLDGAHAPGVPHVHFEVRDPLSNKVISNNHVPYKE
ncbi:hemagglutinin repeat-containing protein [Orrella dioscoreae]|uniref:hemagglutinin repeat-containing protein n=1 Tax=Orrella dioscoreae TaxID=1851544 RepID=UPI0013000E4F|nr:hemagglutinin repeat-containing protein [Orrella dioscoreae]